MISPTPLNTSTAAAAKPMRFFLSVSRNSPDCFRTGNHSSICALIRSKLATNTPTATAKAPMPVAIKAPLKVVKAVTTWFLMTE